MFKRLVVSFTLSLALFASLVITVHAADYTIDFSKASSGIVEVKGDPGSKLVRVQIEKEGSSTSYLYWLSKTNKNVYPLQLGNGKYTVKVHENVGGNQYKTVMSESVNATGITDSSLYTQSIQIVDYSGASSVKEMNKLVAAATNESEKVDILFDYIISNFDYDFDKASKVASTDTYLPVIDTIYSAKKGICYDYSAVLAGVLRSNGIPTKLQMGYTTDIPNQYHAWNEVYVGGSWFKVDSTYDAQVKKANLAVTMKKANDKFSVVKEY